MVWFLGPTLTFLVVFFLFPVFFGLYLSVHRWDMMAPIATMPYVGLRWYTQLFRDPVFVLAFKNTFIYAAGMLIVVPPLALGVALLLNARLRLQAIWRTMYFIPVITSAVAASLVWAYLFDPTFGPLNAALRALHLPPQGFLSDPREALACIIAVSAWQSLGYYAIIFLAGLQGVPPELLEAAALDGATDAQRLRYVTLPMLGETTFFVLVILTISALQIFTQVFVMTGGGPADASNVVVLDIYQTAFQFTSMGKATAMAVVLFVVVMLVTLVQIRTLQGGRGA